VRARERRRGDLVRTPGWVIFWSAVDDPGQFHAGLTLYGVLRTLQTLLAVWTGACHTCHQPYEALRSNLTRAT